MRQAEQTLPARNVALTTGVTGQDGFYLAEFVLQKGYVVHGVKRRASTFNTERIDHPYQNPHVDDRRLVLHYGDLNDTGSIIGILSSVQPDEVYNLGAQSHVGVSFDAPEYTADVNGLGALRILEGIRYLGRARSTRFHQASSSELYGFVRETPQREMTPFHPRSPYGISKLFAYWSTVNYREAYGMFACNGILFNHESSRRGETFVSRKITRGLSRIKCGLDDCLSLGNLDARRDWGHAKDYVEMQWLMLQQDTPDDYVIATGHQYSVREFVEMAAHRLEIVLNWLGTGDDERAMDQHGNTIVRVDPRYFRPAQVQSLLGDAAKARLKLGWQPRFSIEALVEEVVQVDSDAAQRDAMLHNHGYKRRRLNG